MTFAPPALVVLLKVPPLGVTLQVTPAGSLVVAEKASCWRTVSPALPGETAIVSVGAELEDELEELLDETEELLAELLEELCACEFEVGVTFEPPPPQPGSGKVASKPKPRRAVRAAHGRWRLEWNPRAWWPVPSE